MSLTRPMPRVSFARTVLSAALLASVAFTGVCLATPTPVAAQVLEPLSVGDRVRVKLRTPPPSVVMGILTRSDSGTLVIVGSAGALPVAVPRREILAVARSDGQRSRGTAFWRGAGRGALVGVGLSAVLMGVAYVEDQRRPCTDCYITAPVAAAVVSVPLTGLSTLVGGVIGLNFRERWMVVPPDRWEEPAR